MENTHSSLSFTVRCTACSGSEIWTLGRITRLLTAIGKLPPESKSDIEFVAEQFIANRERIPCPGCHRKGVLIVRRIASDA